MNNLLAAVLVCAGIIAVAAVAALLYFLLSPMPIIRLMRRGMDAQLSYPPGYEERKKRVRILRDIPYPSEYGRNVYDLYVPEGKQSVPVIVWLHGGAFVAGNRSGVENWAVMLASEGVAVAAMEYQWAPEARYPAQVEQVCQCLKALKLYEGTGALLDMSRVVLAGDSAGAHIAAQAATLHVNQELAGRLGIKPVLPPEALKSVLLYCGPYDVEKMASPQNRTLRLFMDRIGWSVFGKKNWRTLPELESAVIARYITPDFPPVYLTDGNAHSFEAQGKELAQKLREQGVHVRTRFFPAEDGEVTHEYQFSLEEERAQLCYQDTVAFLREQLPMEAGLL